MAERRTGDTGIGAEKELSLDSKLVKKAYDKIYRGSSYIYKYANFDKSTIPNELKLRLTYSAIDEIEGLALPLSDDYFFETGQTYYYKIDTFDEKMKEIFGENITYEKSTFYAKENLTGGLPELVYNMDEDRFETNFEFGGAVSGAVEQKLLKATTLGNNLYLYVSPIFFKTNYEEYNDEIYDGYINYNYETDTFSNLILKEINPYTDDLEKINYDNYSLNIYKYIFEKQGEEYYFVGLEKIK